ncbi:MAG: hypothetical protein WC205_00265 [Opitutaceae bacterium]
MIPPSTTDPDTLRNYVLELARTCPVVQDNPSGCPLYDIRQLSINERVTWSISLSIEDLKKIIAYHCACRTVKEFMQSLE